MLQLCRAGFSCASELANVIVRRTRLSYRQAHHVTGTVVRLCAERKIPADRTGAALLDEAARAVVGEPLGFTDAEVQEALDPRHFISVHSVTGGADPREVERMVGDRKMPLQEAALRQEARKGRLKDAAALLDQRIRRARTPRLTGGSARSSRLSRAGPRARCPSRRASPSIPGRSAPPRHRRRRRGSRPSSRTAGRTRWGRRCSRLRAATARRGHRFLAPLARRTTFRASYTSSAPMLTANRGLSPSVSKCPSATALRMVSWSSWTRSTLLPSKGMPASWNPTCPLPPTPITWRSMPPADAIFCSYPCWISLSDPRQVFRAGRGLDDDGLARAPAFGGPVAGMPLELGGELLLLDERPVRHAGFTELLREEGEELLDHEVRVALGMQDRAPARCPRAGRCTRRG